MQHFISYCSSMIFQRCSTNGLRSRKWNWHFFVHTYAYNIFIYIYPYMHTYIYMCFDVISVWWFLFIRFLWRENAGNDAIKITPASDRYPLLGLNNILAPSEVPATHLKFTGIQSPRYVLLSERGVDGNKCKETRLKIWRRSIYHACWLAALWSAQRGRQLLFKILFCRLGYWRECPTGSFPPNAAYMRQWTGSALVQIMACRLFGAKPLSNPVLLLSIGSLGTNFMETGNKWPCGRHVQMHFVER